MSDEVLRPEINWFTPPVGDGVGYGYAAVETIRGIQSHGIKVSYQAEDIGQHTKAIINFIQPDYYRGLKDQYRIGYTPWESSVIPDRWISHMKEMDEIWTTCNYNKETFESYGVNSTIRLVPHGINPEIWKIYNRYLTDKFIFFHIGAPTQRKGGQRVVNAFLDLFGDNPDVWLLMKSNGVSDCRITYRGQFMNAANHDRILIIEDQLDVVDLVKLYNKAHCLVYPTNGEGFGLIPFQGIATGLPTIVTNGTACADFANLSVPLDCRPAPGVGIHLGEWVEPDPNDLRDKMLYVYNNYETVKEKTLHSANIIQTTQTWGHIGKQIIDILGDKIYERI